MSIDYSFVCMDCQCYIHAGQEMGGKESFGYGSKDEKGAAFVMQWLIDHTYGIEQPAEHPCHLQFRLTDEVPDHFQEISDDETEC